MATTMKTSLKNNSSFMRERAYVWGEDGTRFITHQLDAVLEVKRIVETMGRLMASRKTPFGVVTKHGREWVEKTELGDSILLCLKSGLREIDEHFPAHRHSPLFTLFKRFLGPFMFLGGKVWPEDVPRLNAAVAKIRAFAKGEALGRRLGNLKRAERENAKSCKRLLKALRARYSKLLVVRLDLEYFSNFCPGSGFRGQAMTLKDAQAHRDRFLDHLRKGAYAEHLAGYIWKMEYGLEKGHHFHMAIFFDGQRVSRDIVLGDLLGRYWQEKVTASKGMFFNCNKKKDAYDRCGIGMVNRGDDEKWTCLEDALRYLTKVDLYLRFRPDGRARTFGLGGPYGGVKAGPTLAPSLGLGVKASA
ncbi:YagK/YfjJ domain-containing protein [Stenotrophomonas maltophilia]|uniref:YagK/YfjJ domain-containing protein n=1 Tax=Stenotrophomonas maltophilia TaxID=40324 RepID=UPI002096F736|nr:inovirus-type Gp2 protein [Stenotrophomonas maltophilia]MCO7456858.1 inovirus Gp2 family protein [Stenotrophomonas maltophilia]MCO7465271.1 inovirus Gp2 family protein [Stenotrophomonas maltophilia]MCO7483096.1 inovirus Gp2 family protein [Stenotrophomonas maltophilia]MCO7491940.1 inovirus Gp2 family protein [Stenotrophomonas maltophilia]